MTRPFPLTRRFSADCEVGDRFLTGELYHIRKNLIGSGSVSTPIGRYFARRPAYVEGTNPHWRLDCFVRKHDLAGDPEKMTRALSDALLQQGHLSEPLWMSWHLAEELAGDMRGALWEDG